MGGMGDGMMSGWMWLLPVVIAIALLAGALVYAFRSRPARSIRPTSREIVDRRYAAGELTRDEYIELRHDIDDR